ncbi:hypothetical protein [Sphaerisporangium album]|uniref:hypothetical protein n=1 Tax=Sphaerisporangium album TaxID=509200 RepID=UPI0015F0176B|nr:hypothetical protein [Sphaerisporangium album]
MHRSPYETWVEIKFIDEFIVLPEHIALLRRGCASWVGDDWRGAPGLDPKRPFRNSDVYGDIAAIVDGREVYGHDDEQVSDADRARYDRLFAECVLALQIVLETGSFEPGRYVLAGLPGRWQRAK